MTTVSREPPFTETFVIDAELTLSHGDTTFSIWSEGGRLVLNAPSIRSLRLLDQLLTTEALPEQLTTLRSELVTAGPPLELQVRRVPIARSCDPKETSSRGEIHTTYADHSILVLPRGLLSAAIRWLP